MPADSPTPAAPAGSGWLVWRHGDVVHSWEEASRRWKAEAEAQRARAEAAEREWDEARDAATAREAGLREVAEAALSQWKWDIAEPEAVPTRTSLDEIDSLRDRLASLAAPEGGTSRPTPPEGT